MSWKKYELGRGRIFRVHVRLPAVDWQRLCQEENLLRKSKAELLRESYRGRLSTKILMDKDGEQKFLAELNRIGNNINQLTRKANSGDAVPEGALTSLVEELKVLSRYVLRF